MHGPQVTPIVSERDQLIEQHRSYVRALSVETLSSLPVRVELDELIAYGQLGLVEAAERYDRRRGVSFATFAYYRIKGAIYDGLREMGYYPRSAQARMRFAANDLLRTAADDDYAADAQQRVESVDDEIAAAQATIDALIPAFLLSLDTDVGIPDVADGEPPPDHNIERGEVAGKLRALIGELPEDCRRVIIEVYFKDTSMIELAAQLGVNRSWISRLHTRAIQHLHKKLRRENLLDVASLSA